MFSQILIEFMQISSDLLFLCRKENNYRRSTQTLYICFVIFLKMVIIVLVIFAYGVSHAVESARDKKEEDGKEEEEEERAGGRGKE